MFGWSARVSLVAAVAVAAAASSSQQRQRESQGGWLLYVCVLHRATSSTHPLTHPRRKARGSSVRIYTYTGTFNKNTRQSRQSVRRCSANILFISADGFSVLARVVVHFFLSSLFSRNLKERAPRVSYNREHPLPTTTRKAPRFLHHIPVDSYLCPRSFAFPIIACLPPSCTGNTEGLKLFPE